MKILTVCQYYYPEPFRISDICEELVRRGNEVFVITGIPNYPMGEIYPDYRNGQKRDEVINGVRVHRCFNISRKTGAVRRFLNYYSFVISSLLYVSKIKEEFDVVFVNQLSPVMMAYAGIKYKIKHHKKLILYCLDLWPESLVTGGINRGSAIYRCFHSISRKIYKQADRILIASKSFAQYFQKEFGITNTVYLPQYAEAIFTKEQCTKQPNETIDLMFAGNVGAAQSVDTIILAANDLRNEPRARWHIVGDGKELDRCRKLAQDKQLTSVIFHGRKPLEEMPAYYSMADAMLVTLMADPVLSSTLPGKVQSYMAAGKPLIGAADGETARVIRDADCGFCAKAEDYRGLAKAVLDFCNCTERERLADNAYEYFLNNYTQEEFMTQLEKWMQE